MLLGRVNTAAPGIQRTPYPSRVSRVRYAETPSGSGSTVGCTGKPTVRRAQSLGGNRMPKKRMPVAEKATGKRGSRPAPPPVVSYNWPDTGPGART
jgi:hypothetical protein